jgi:hypothetical protein
VRARPSPVSDAGVNLLWGPVQLTNFTLRTYGDYGSVTTVGYFEAPVVMDSASTVNIEGNFTVANQNWGVYSIGRQLGTLNIADGPVAISGGIMQVNANMVQSSDPNDHFAHVEIFNGGHLMLAGSSSGGEIDITTGTLEFSQSPGFMHGPENRVGEL